MIRTETIPLVAAANSASYRHAANDVASFMVARKPGGAVQFPVLARCRYAGELEWQSLVLWEGQVYRPARKLDALALALPAGAKAGDVWLTWATHRYDRIGDAAPVAPSGGVLWDSGLVAGAVITSPVLDLAAAREVEVLVDNTAAATLTATRDLSLLSYLDDGTTLVDTAPVRRVNPGLAASVAGATFDPGRERIVVGPEVSAGARGAHVLFDLTGDVGGAIAFGGLPTESADAVEFQLNVSGPGMAAALATQVGRTAEVSGEAVAIWSGNVGGAGVSNAVGCWGLGAATHFQWAAVAAPVPRRMYMSIPPVGGVGTPRLLVIGHGRPPGTYAVARALPARGAFRLSTGAANARVIIRAR